MNPKTRVVSLRLPIDVVDVYKQFADLMGVPISTLIAQTLSGKETLDFLKASLEVAKIINAGGEEGKKAKEAFLEEVNKPYEKN